MNTRDLNFYCSHRWDDGEVDEWSGTITQIKKSSNLVELKIRSRSSLYVICGKGERGYWACVPDYFAGCDLSSRLGDSLYNTEKLYSATDNFVDSITIASALKLLSTEKIL